MPMKTIPPTLGYSQSSFSCDELSDIGGPCPPVISRPVTAWEILVWQQQWAVTVRPRASLCFHCPLDYWQPFPDNHRTFLLEATSPSPLSRPVPPSRSSLCVPMPDIPGRRGAGRLGTAYATSLEVSHGCRVSWGDAHEQKRIVGFCM